MIPLRWQHEITGKWFGFLGIPDNPLGVFHSFGDSANMRLMEKEYCYTIRGNFYMIFLHLCFKNIMLYE